MFELIVFIIFIASLLGITFILLRKIPVLVSLPKNGNTGLADHHLVQNFMHRVGEVLIAFEKQIYLHKALSFLKVMTLKLEVKIDHLLHGVRKKAQEVEKKKTTRRKKKLP